MEDVARMLARLIDCLRDSRGATVVEYGLIVALVVLVMLGALSSVASRSVSMWNNVSARVNEA
jgi:pilus assembly protein Flp/PilA